MRILRPTLPLSFRMLLASSLLLAFAGCGDDDDAPRDAGAVRRDATAPTDASSDMPDLASPAPVCEGAAFACPDAATQAECEAIRGCGWTRCAGFALACDRRNLAQCGADTGCSWDGTMCRGNAAPCADRSDMTTCGAQAGCTWSGAAERCRGAATLCSEIMEPCRAQPGCRTAIPGVDGGPPDLGFDAGVEGDASMDAAIVPTWDGGGACALPAESPFACDPRRGLECDGDWTSPDPVGDARCPAPCAASECCVPRGGAFTCVAREPTGVCPLPDLVPDATRLARGLRFEYQRFAADDCAVLSGCVGGTGTRRLLRFDSFVANTGSADLYLGSPGSSPAFEPSACGTADEVPGYAGYELLDPAKGCLTASGGLAAGCVFDYFRYPGTDTSGGVYDCAVQGIQSGYQNVYAASQSCQWIDVTGLPGGPYTLRITVNSLGRLAESNYANDVVEIPVEIPVETNLTAPCDGAMSGERRDCGWTRGPTIPCTPGRSITIGCSAACGVGTCTGDPVLRVCPSGPPDGCARTAALASNDDSGCETMAEPDRCARVVVSCPSIGAVDVFYGSVSTDSTATCSVAVMR